MVTLLGDHVAPAHDSMVTQKRDHATRPSITWRVTEQ
jgi:hypothetical protein